LLRFPASIVRGVVIFLLAGVSVFGCKASPKSDQSLVHDVSSLTSESYPEVEKPVADGLAAALAKPAEAPPASPRPLQVLALSGGVGAAPFAAGALVGWTESGTRPTFDVVTGISGGALLGVYAFLGPKYDPKLKELILTLTSSDLVKVQPLRHFLRDGAFGSAAPAERLLETKIDDGFLADLQQAHAEGRRFFVGTMDMQTKQLVIWDVGALASSGRPDAAVLVRKVLLAAFSWPGLLPPVEFNAEVDGRCYHEQHFDGGASAMAFVRFGPFPGWPERGEPARPGWLKGSNLYVLACRKLYSDPAPVRKRAVARTLAFMNATFEALTRADIARLYSLCAVSGMQFHLLAMPQEIPDEDLGFGGVFPKEARQLFETGYHLGVAGLTWRLTPPGAEPGEEVVPRDGTQIDTCH
jgi:hypothetical protein